MGAAFPGTAAIHRPASPLRRRNRPGRTGGLSRKAAPYLFILPNMLVFGVFTIWPAVNGFNISFYDSNNGRTFRPVGLQNYRTILSDAEFWGVVRHTVVFVAGFVTLVTILSTALALMLNHQVRARGVLRAAFFIPVIVSPVVVGLIWGWLLSGDNGLVNAVFGGLGLGRPGWLVNPKLAMGATIAVGLWTHVGFYGMIQLAGLQGIDGALFEASKLDGATTWQQIRRVTLPLLRPTTMVVVMLSTIVGFQAFDFIWTLTGGGPVGATTLLVQYIYEKGFTPPVSYGLASAAGVLLFLVVLVITLVNYLVGRRRAAI